MILIIDNGMYANTLNQYVLDLNFETLVISLLDINPRILEKLNLEAIIISNGNDRKETIHNIVRIIQSYIWKVPILGIGSGAISLGLLFNTKICDSKLSNFDVLNIIHDNRTVYHHIGDLSSTKWCRYAISEELFKKTDLEITAKSNKEIIGFRHKNLAIEGILFDITSFTCLKGKEIMSNFLSYYIK